jgi:hypothetical protein
MSSTPPPNQSIGRDDALLWLNDRDGETVTLSVTMDLGNYSRNVLTVHGRLLHWHQDREGSAWRGQPDQDIAGWYLVGETATLNLTEMKDGIRYGVDESELVFSLGHDAEMRIQHATERVQ